MENSKLNFEGYDLPWHTRDALVRYVEQGVYPGGFLTAVLCNELFLAVAHADSENQRALADIVKFIYNRVPTGAWGSAQATRDWVKFFGPRD